MLVVRVPLYSLRLCRSTCTCHDLQLRIPAHHCFPSCVCVLLVLFTSAASNIVQGLKWVDTHLGRMAESDVTFLKAGKLMQIIMCESSYTVYKVLSPGCAFLGTAPDGSSGAHSGLPCIGLWCQFGSWNGRKGSSEPPFRKLGNPHWSWKPQSWTCTAERECV